MSSSETFCSSYSILSLLVWLISSLSKTTPSSWIFDPVQLFSIFFFDFVLETLLILVSSVVIVHVLISEAFQGLILSASKVLLRRSTRHALDLPPPAQSPVPKAVHGKIRLMPEGSFPEHYYSSWMPACAKPLTFGRQSHCGFLFIVIVVLSYNPCLVLLN